MLVRKEVIQDSVQSELHSSLTPQAWFGMQKCHQTPNSLR